MPQYSLPSLKAALNLGELSGRSLIGSAVSVTLADVARGTCLGVPREDVGGRSLVIATAGQMTAATALIELDGLARRLVLCPPDLDAAYLAPIAADAEADAVVSDRDPHIFDNVGFPVVAAYSPPLARHKPEPSTALSTEWVLLTSGTTGVPKLAVHSLAALIDAIEPVTSRTSPVVWATFYDIRRYGGLQIFLRAVLGRTSLVLSEPGEDVVDHLHRLAANRVTHISGTPTHWRRVLMCSAAMALSPDYVRLSGEIADQAVLDGLKELYPRAEIVHAYASTEAGVGFEVRDGLEGFPAQLVEARGAVDMKVEEGSLRIRSRRTASRYLGGSGGRLMDADGFVDTGDIVERRGDRYYFVGRQGGIINVGGLKVHPEEVEAIINRHRGVRMSRVRSRRSPIIGAVVVADVVLNPGPAPADQHGGDAVKDEIIELCRGALPPHKVPAAIRFVPSLAMTATGKIARHDA